MASTDEFWRICDDQGVCHCDWRLTIYGCEEEDQLRAMYIALAVVSGLVGVLGEAFHNFVFSIHDAYTYISCTQLLWYYTIESSISNSKSLICGRGIRGLSPSSQWACLEQYLTCVGTTPKICQHVVLKIQQPFRSTNGTRYYSGD